MFAHRSPAANGILNDMDEKNEMDDMEVLDSFESCEVWNAGSRIPKAPLLDKEGWPPLRRTRW